MSLKLKSTIGSRQYYESTKRVQERNRVEVARKSQGRFPIVCGARFSSPDTWDGKVEQSRRNDMCKGVNEEAEKESEKAGEHGRSRRM